MGKFKLDTSIREYFNARLDAIYGTTVRESNVAVRRAEKILANLDAEQRGLVGVIARGMARY